MSWLLNAFKKTPTQTPPQTEQAPLEIERVEEDIQPENDPQRDPEQRSIGSLLKSILSQVRLGSDVLSSGISLPAWLYEPMSVLQRQAEMLEYAELLDRASECVDTLDRMAFVAAFAVSGYSGTQRYHNAFNPILGETYEYVDEKNGFKYISEQVSHHPPISATHADSKNWVFYQNSNPGTSLLGNAIEIDTRGKTHVYFSKSKDHYFYTNPKTRVHNLIFGKMWMEHHGELNFSNMKNGESCILTFKKCGFFGSSVEYKIEGFVKDAEGNNIIALKGAWNDYLEATWLQETKDSPQGKTELLWKLPEDNFVNDRFQMTKFASNLNYVADELRDILPPTDSRLRLDKLCLEQGDYDGASRVKKVIEERQRSDKKARTENGDEWTPQLFHKIPNEDGTFTWVYCGDYWEQRDNKIKASQDGGDIENYLNGGLAKETAADFRSYVL